MRFHLVDEVMRGTWNLSLPGARPGLGLRLDPAAPPTSPCTAPSRTRIEALDLDGESTWPGVSMMCWVGLRVRQALSGSRGGGDVMPRSPPSIRSIHRGSASIALADLVDAARCKEEPLAHVVLPASMCAGDADVRWRSIGVLRAMVSAPNTWAMAVEVGRKGDRDCCACVRGQAEVREALFASAMRCTSRRASSSRRRGLDGLSGSLAGRCAIDFSPRGSSPAHREARRGGQGGLPRRNLVVRTAVQRDSATIGLMLFSATLRDLSGSCRTSSRHGRARRR